MPLHHQAEQSKVIVGIGSVTMALHLLLHHRHHLIGTAKMHLLKDGQKTIIAKLLLLHVLSFIQTIGIYEEETVLDTVNLFADIL